MKKQLSTFVKGAAVVVPLSGVIPQGESCAWFGENFFKNILYYLGYLNPVCWWKWYFGKSQLNVPLENEQRVTRETLNKKSDVARESVLKRFKELSEKSFFDEENRCYLPELKLVQKNGELLLNTRDHEYYCKHVGENLGSSEATAYRIRFEEDKVSFCNGKNNKVIYDIYFDDSNFDDRLLQLSNHIRKIGAFLNKIDLEILTSLSYNGFWWGEIRLDPAEEMRAGFGNKSSEKLNCIFVSTDYQYITLSTQDNGKHYITKKYDLYNPKDADNLFSVYNKYRRVDSECNYDFDPKMVVKEKQED